MRKPTSPRCPNFSFRCWAVLGKVITAKQPKRRKIEIFGFLPVNFSKGVIQPIDYLFIVLLWTYIVYSNAIPQKLTGIPALDKLAVTFSSISRFNHFETSSGVRMRVHSRIFAVPRGTSSCVQGVGECSAGILKFSITRSVISRIFNYFVLSKILLKSSFTFSILIFRRTHVAVVS